MSKAETCVSCGALIPEGLQVCPMCKPEIICVTPDRGKNEPVKKIDRGDFAVIVIWLLGLIACALCAAAGGWAG